jgi:hypothetical protein
MVVLANGEKVSLPAYICYILSMYVCVEKKQRVLKK